jgi:hypothetical protein
LPEQAFFQIRLVARCVQPGGCHRQGNPRILC